MVHATLGEGCRGNTGQSDEDSTVLQKGRTQAWLVGEGGEGRPARDLASINPSCKTQSACHKETFTGIAKRELVGYRELRPYILLVSCGAKCVVATAGSRDLTP